MYTKDEIIFTETQYFRQAWLWAILIALHGLFLFGLYKQLIAGQPFGTKPISNNGLIFSYALIFLITIWFRKLRLETIINKTAIQVRFFPFQVKYKTYSWNDISKAEVIQYHPLLDYGGWGLRFGFKGKAYNVSGNRGIQIVLKNGSKMLIGTQKEAAAKLALQQIKNLYPKNHIA